MAAKGGDPHPSAAKGRCQTYEPSGPKGPVNLKNLFIQPFCTACGEAATLCAPGARPSALRAAKGPYVPYFLPIISYRQDITVRYDIDFSIGWNYNISMNLSIIYG